MATLVLKGRVEVLRAMLLAAARDLSDKSGIVTVTFDSDPDAGTVAFTGPSDQKQLNIRTARALDSGRPRSRSTREF